MNKIVFALCSVIALAVCSPACSPEAAPATLSEEKVARIMADLYIAEAATIGLSGNPKDSLLQIYCDQVFQVHGTTQAEYEKNLHLMAQEEQRIERIVQLSVDLVQPEKDKKEAKQQDKPEEE